MRALTRLADGFRSPATRGIWPWVAASPLLIVLFEYLAVAPVGSDLFLGLRLPFGIGLLAAVPALVVLPFVAISRKRRKEAFAWWLVCLFFIPLVGTGLIIGNKIRIAAFHDLASRSSSLVRAIEKFTDRHGSPPSSLEELVPDFLEEIPGTGVMAYPEYRYEKVEGDRAYEGNPWILSIPTPSGGINFDEFYYFPLQNYPENGSSYGGSFERVRDWAYLHE